MSVAAAADPTTRAVDPRAARSRRAAASRNGLATVWMIGSVAASRSSRSCFIVGYVVQQGPRRSSSWSFLTEDLPIISRSRRAAASCPAIVGTLVITFGAAASWRSRSACSPRSTSTSTAARADSPRVDPLHGRRHDRRAVDRDGPVHLHDLGSSGLHRATRASPARSRSACLMLPIVIRSTRGDAASSCPTICGRRATRSAPAAGARSSRVVLPAALPGIVSGAMLAVARAAGETAPLLFTIGVVAQRRTPTRSRARTPRCPMQIWNNAQQPFPAAQRPRVGRGAHADHDRVRAAP